MGIQNLYRLIREFAPGAISTVSMEDLDSWRIGIDASLSIYQWCSVGSARKIVNNNGKFINHIQGAFFRTVAMITSGIIPVFVFDGAPPKVKAETIAERKLARDAGDAVRVPREVFSEVSKLITLMGVMTMQAPSEAEAQAAFLTTNDSLDAVATEDMDAVTFGARYMIRGLDTAAKNITIIDTEKVLNELRMTKEQFIDLCILLGSDYTTTTIPGVGYKTALTLIRKYGSIEKILAEKSINPPIGFTYKEARAEFTNPVVSRVKLNADLRRMTAEDIVNIQNFLVDTHGLDPTRVKKSLNKLARHYGL